MRATAYGDEIVQKLWDKSEITDSCWLWQGASSHGYGYISIVGQMALVHRVAYSLLVSDIPEGMDVCHKCDINNCWNPDHLFVGTVHDNMADIREKGRDINRNPHGEASHHHVLSEEDVRGIMQDHANGLTYRHLVFKYNISKSQVHRIIKRQSWTHLE